MVNFRTNLAKFDQPNLRNRRITVINNQNLNFLAPRSKMMPYDMGKVHGDTINSSAITIVDIKKY